MKRAWPVVLVLAAMTSSAQAEDRTWQGVFAGTVAVGLGGGFMYWHGVDSVHDAERELCEGGAYDAFSSVDCDGPPTHTLMQAEVEELNDKGDRGSMIAMIGAGTIGVTVAFGAYAFYKGWIAEDKDEPRVVFAPTASPHGAGAALQLRW